MDYAGLLLERSKGKGLLLDSNLLLLLLVGAYDRNLIGNGRYNKLSKYTLEDLKILVRLKSMFSRVATTAHVLTELSNLAGDFPESIKTGCFHSFRKSFASLDELSASSREAAQRPEFHFLGLTDSVLAHFTPEFLMVSDDARLVAKLSQSGLESLNFNHLRQYLVQL